MTTASVARRQRRAQRAMADTFALLRSTEVQDSEGGTTKQWAAVARGKCLLLPLAAGSANVQIAGRLGLLQPMRALLPVGTDVRLADRLEVGTRTFEVRSAVVAETAGAFIDAMVEQI